MKGTKLIALKVHQNAQPHNNSKDHPSGKEHRGEIVKIRASSENLANVVPQYYGPGPGPAITKPISERKLALVKRHAGFGARD